MDETKESVTIVPNPETLDTILRAAGASEEEDISLDQAQALFFAGIYSLLYLGVLEVDTLYLMTKQEIEKHY